MLFVEVRCDPQIWCSEIEIKNEVNQGVRGVPPYRDILRPWSRFRYIKYDLSKCFLRVDVTVKTRTLTTPHLPEPRLQRLRLIDDLHQKGLDNREIADHLNQRGLISPRGGSYSPKLVWATLKKFDLRKERIKDTTYTIDGIFP